MLSEGGIQLEKAINIAKSMVLARENVITLNKTEEDTQINVIKKKSYKQKQHQSTKTCTKCGQIHRTKCPAENAICQRRGHFAKMCFIKGQQ